MWSNYMSVQCKDFENKVLDSKKPVLVSFCTKYLPIYSQTQTIFDNLSKVFKWDLSLALVYTDKSIWDKYRVYWFPTLMLFKDGKQVWNKLTDRLIWVYMTDEYKKKAETHLYKILEKCDGLSSNASKKLFNLLDHSEISH